MDFLIPVEPVDCLPQMPWRDKLAYLAFRFSQLDQMDCPLEHSFEDGQYIRHIAIPKGTFFVGRIHKLGHQVDLLTGSVIHIREKCRRIVQAPFTLMTSPGDQVCALTLTDITARTVHPTQGCENIETLEERFFETSQSLCDQGKRVDEKLKELLYERDSSSSWRSSGRWGRSHHVCRI